MGIGACGEPQGQTTGIQNPTDTGGGAGPVDGIGNSCDPVVDLQRCIFKTLSSQRERCDAVTSTWELLEVCGADFKCAESAAASGNNRMQTNCEEKAVKPLPDTSDGATGDVIDSGGTAADADGQTAGGDTSAEAIADTEPDPCGDGKCAAPENSITCPIDCPAPQDCGNELCEPGEDDSNCAEDCGYSNEYMLCLQAKCLGPYKACNLDDNCSSFVECSIDCGGTVKCIELCAVGLAGNTLSKAKAVIGCAFDNKCYPIDCGDGACQGPAENGVNCKTDCKAGGPICGDSVCAAPETHTSCPGDCKTATSDCGNGECETGESPQSCPKDCQTALLSGCDKLCGKKSQEDGKPCYCDDLCATQTPPDCCSDKEQFCPKAACTPKCVGKKCGDDNCGGECGSCPDGQTCKADGSACLSASLCGNQVCDAGESTTTCPGDCPCVKKCEGKACGSDGCGGLCAKCATGSNCNSTGTLCVPKTCGNAICETGETAVNCLKDCSSCTKNCTGKICGSDGCTGTCGACPSGQTCKADGTGCSATCTKNCSGKVCGSDGCGGSCGACPSGQTCKTDGSACSATCTKNCTGKVCGSDGCSGTCGTCATGQTCKTDGSGCSATCTKKCTGKVCGSDGCSGTCGTCAAGQTCKTDGTACTGTGTCTKQCSGKLCGSDGCGGVCGTCAAPKECNLGTGGCVNPTCGNGVCASGETCTADCAPAAVGCKNNCGKQSKDAAGATCWCDSFCDGTGDCCADKKQWCP